MVRIEPYCSGIDPGEDYRNPVFPWSGELSLREGGKNADGPIVAELEADAEGRFSAVLPAGRYCVVTGDKKLALADALEAAQARPNPFGLDLACVERTWRRCDHVLELGQGSLREVQIRFMSDCGWDVPCAPNKPDPPPSIER